jgi:hypothetical protein
MSLYLSFFLLLWNNLGAETTKLCRLFTYNNMGSKNPDYKGTFASLTLLKKRLSRIC